MKKLLRVNPAFYAAACCVALLVTGVLLGGFGQTRNHGSLICLDCIGIFQLGSTGTIVVSVAIAVVALLFVLLALAIIFRFKTRNRV